MRWWCGVVLVAISLCAQTPPHSVSSRTAADQTLALVHSVPPEFAADALIQIAALPSNDFTRKAELTEAFHLAADAQEKVALRLVSGGGPAAQLHATLLRGMDSISLRDRAVEGLIVLDPKLALQLLLKSPWT